MSNSYRIRTTPGIDKSITVAIDQEFEYLEILSLKILQDQIYTRQCSDYGVVVGRVSVNNGFGLPNVKISVFVPLSDEDSFNPLITEVYPYKTIANINDEGYRYNLLPYKQQHLNHVPTGTFFDKEDVLKDPILIEVYDKYYKYTTTTNESGDYMIFGVPIGQQTIFVDIDLSDIGEFSLTPNDLIRMGVATEDMVDKNKFKSSNNLDTLPQIISFNRNIEVVSLWGETELCSIGITRTDFDISEEANIVIEPTAVFMGSIISTIDEAAIKENCKPNKKLGELCSLAAGPGEILSIRQTIDFDEDGRPILELYNLQGGGQVIDEDGVWLIDLPMNLDYVITNEYGEQIISADPTKGIPTKGKYRFKIKWNQPPGLSAPIKRAVYLVPNVREYGHDDEGNVTDQNAERKSYAFSLDWNDYGDTGTTVGLSMIETAINCEDKFYEFQYNKIYTISNLITQYRYGLNKRKYISIKNILDEQCESENNKFPSNDAQKRTDIIFILFTIVMIVLYIVLSVIIVLVHILSFIVNVILQPFIAALGASYLYQAYLKGASAYGAFVPPGAPGLAAIFILEALAYIALAGVCTLAVIKIQKIKKYFKNFSIPNFTYPDCELCNCAEGTPQNIAVAVDSFAGEGTTNNQIPQNDKGTALLTPYTNGGLYQPNSIGGGTYPQPITELMSGVGIPAQGTIGPGVGTTCLCNSFNYEDYTCNQITPYTTIEEKEEDDEVTVEIRNWRAFSTDLPLPERINLFNVKAKYFEQTVPNISYNTGISFQNGGKGTNQIKVRFAKDLNNPSTPLTSLPLGTSSHLDNVLAIVVQDGVGSSFVQGQMVTFQDSTMSNDINFTGATANDFGLNSITGTSLLQSATTTPVTVTWANPNGIGQGGNYTTIYNLTGTSINGTMFHQFPMDVEYFQVITAMTYSDYILKSSTQLDNSLRSRYLENTFYINRIKRYKGSCCFGNVIVEGQYKLNIPIQGGPRNTQHIGNNTTSDTYSGHKLFYPSYQFLPSDMSGFTTQLTNYYSKVDNNNPDNNGAAGTQNELNLGLKVGYPNYNTNQTSGPNNQYLIEWSSEYEQSGCKAYAPTPYSLELNKRRYYKYENIEGGSFLSIYYVTILDPSNGKCKKEGDAACANTRYYCPRYTAGYSINVSPNIVMRSDRLPTSTFDFKPDPNNDYYRPLHANPGFEIYLIDDAGGNANPPYNSGVSDSGSFEDGFKNSPVLDSLSCNNLAPFSCYYTNEGVTNIRQKNDKCWQNGINGDLIMRNGCYVFVTVPLLSILKDTELLVEWRARLIYNFAACRNVFGHTFTNNWINGTLFAFPFKNETTFDKELNPVYDYCDNVIYRDTTVNNFYYRSAAYSNTNKFVGVKSISTEGNARNLMYPTTVMDLGPRDYFVQEMSMTDDFDGYVANKLNSTTFNDVSELLNQFMLNRLTGRSLLQNIFAVSVNNFFSRKNDMIDGDYAQMNSINSEFGVVAFDPTTYKDTDIVQNLGDKDNVFGIFFSSNTEFRDFISPKRTIYFGGGPVSLSDCAFGNIPVKTQEVPFYQWEIKDNESSDDNNIFGSQKNEWFADKLNGVQFLSFKYQSMDRLLSSCRYFRTNNQSQTDFFKGYIYSVDSTGKISANISDWNQNTYPNRVITVGAPFHFYFGLKKGASAFDKFGRQWLDFEKFD